MLFDDPLDVPGLVADGDDESPRIASHGLVLCNFERSNPLETQGVGTLADQPVHEVGIGGAFSEVGCDLGDPLVDLPEDRLVFCEARKTWFGIHQAGLSPRWRSRNREEG